MHEAADVGRPSPALTAHDAPVYDALRGLCLLRDTGSVTEPEFARRQAALLGTLGCRLSTKSPLLITGSDPYAEERAASW